MKILHLETSSKNCSVAISHDENLLCLCEENTENYKQSENLHTFVKWALEGADIQLKDLDAICLGMGPGSYTGLRIGASAAKGFCFGLGIPLIAVNSLESMVFPFLGKGYDAIIPLIDARRMEVYTAIYDGESGEIIFETTPLILNEFSFNELDKKNILFIGNGATKAQEILCLKNAKFDASVFPTAKYLIPNAIQKFNQKVFEDIAYFEPLYLKGFQGQKLSGK